MKVKKRYRVSIVFATILIALIFPPYLALGVNGHAVLWQVFMEYLEGGQPGIVKISVVSVDEGGSPIQGVFMIRVHNFTEYWLKPHSEIIYQGGASIFSFAISRIPLRYGIPDGETEARIIYKSYEYTIFVLEERACGKGANRHFL